MGSLREIEKRGQKECRKANFMKKIRNGDRSTKASSFLKRKPTLMKKAKELEILCGNEVTIVCYDASGNVDFWPENLPEVKRRCSDYLQLNSTEKKEMNYFDLVRSKKKKILMKKGKTGNLDVDLLISNLSNWVDRESVIMLENKVEKLKQRIGFLKKGEEVGRETSPIDPMNVECSCLANVGQTKDFCFDNNEVVFPGDDSSNFGSLENSDFDWQFEVLNYVEPENMIYIGEEETVNYTAKQNCGGDFLIPIEYFEAELNNQGENLMSGPQESLQMAQLIAPPLQLISHQMLSPEMEKALVEVVMSLTPEQINLLSLEQRNQVLQFQQMLSQ